ncbi:Phosphorylase b kinase gamma catalytic chain, skeletal muscle/heart isoform [Exophiala xenobiotica]|nr:Phosphorylase b kinase gamma catalytic chain, skeletal muscle/heart isoform [Exophiala xenobiotica]
MSPEVLDITQEGYDTRVDIWSTGVLMYFLMTGSLPFRTCHESVQIQYDWPEKLDLSEDLLRARLVISTMLQPAAIRWNAEHIVALDFFTHARYSESLDHGNDGEVPVADTSKTELNRALYDSICHAAGIWKRPSSSDENRTSGGVREPSRPLLCNGMPVDPPIQLPGLSTLKSA